jgi:hypothetical protein
MLMRIALPCGWKAGLFAEEKQPLMPDIETASKTTDRMNPSSRRPVLLVKYQRSPWRVRFLPSNPMQLQFIVPYLGDSNRAEE